VARRLARDEEGFALVIALALITLLTIIAVALLFVTQGENTRSQRDTKKTGAYQAAEAGTNAYLSDLTESTVFFNSWLAKGEATRRDASSVTHASSNASDVTWSSGSSWTYATPAATDTGWFDLGNGYSYLIKVFPPTASLQSQAAVITRIDVIGRPSGGTDTTTWREIETMIRPSSITDFQTFTATSVSYASTATTTGPIFVGEDKNRNPGTLNHAGTAQANLYAEGSVTGSTTMANGAKKYDKNTTPTALCKVNNCNPVLFSSFQSTITTVNQAATAGGIVLGSKDNSNSGLSGQSYNVDAWKLNFLANGTVQISSCKLYSQTVTHNGVPTTTTWNDYDGSNAPVCGTATTQNVPSNGAIYSATDVLVSGVVKGKVTVASSGDIVFGGNTTYNTNGTDILGLEAQGTIYVAQWAVTGSTLNLWAAELALNGPFEADPLYNGGATATMNFNGSTAVYGGGSGAIIFSNLFAHRNYIYDNNLKFLQPPYFPTLGNAFVVLVQRTM
jgi:Tfp pilus assembly protein PilX